MKDCWVKNITATKLYITNEKQCLPPIFTRKSWSSPSMIFQKSQTPINKGGSHYVWSLHKIAWQIGLVL